MRLSIDFNIIVCQKPKCNSSASLQNCNSNLFRKAERGICTYWKVRTGSKYTYAISEMPSFMLHTQNTFTYVLSQDLLTCFSRYWQAVVFSHLVAQQIIVFCMHITVNELNFSSNSPFSGTTNVLCLKGKKKWQ